MNAAPAGLGSAAADDHRFMRLALVLGRRGLGRTWPNPAVGAVVVRDDPAGPVIVGRGWTQPGGRPHAETEALRRGGAATRGATLYVTLEPCSHHGRTPPCADAIVAAGIRRVVSALEDPNPLVAGQGHARLRAAGLVVDVGIASEQARRAHAGHITRVRDARPHVTLKLAISADGKVALSGRRPVAITGEDARTRVHVMRAQNDAILIGIGTALSDDPALTCRLAGMQARSPVRIVLDPALRLPPESRLVRTAEETPVWLFGVKDASAAAEETLRLKGVEIIDTDISQDQMDVRAVLQELAARGITRLMVEGGPITAAAFVAADLVDEAYLFRSELRIGPDGIDALEGLPLEALTQSPQLKLVYSEPVGADRLDYFKRV